MKILNLQDFKKKKEYSLYLKSLNNQQLSIEVDAIISRAANGVKEISYSSTNVDFDSKRSHENSQKKLLKKAQMLVKEISCRLSGPAKVQLEKIVLDSFEVRVDEK